MQIVYVKNLFDSKESFTWISTSKYLLEIEQGLPITITYCQVSLLTTILYDYYNYLPSSKSYLILVNIYLAYKYKTYFIVLFLLIISITSWYYYTCYQVNIATKIKSRGLTKCNSAE